MEHLITIGMKDGKPSKDRLREKMTEGMVLWPHSSNVAEMLMVKKKEVWKNMITSLQGK